MYQHNGIQTYRKTNVITADPGKLVILCYEGAVDNLRIAKRKHNEAKYEEKANHINKTKNIIDELLCSLDIEKGGLIARNLQSLYLYMIKRILQSDVNSDMGGIDEVIGMLNELLSAWREVTSRPESQVQHSQNDLYLERRAVGSGYISV